MSAEQLEVVIRDVHACFGSWTPETSMAQMRKDWDDVFSLSPCSIGAKRETVDMGGVPALKLTAPGAVEDRAILYFHGGGYVFGSPRSHRDLGEYLSREARAVVFMLDYRLAPEHPFPAPVEDATTAYRWMLENGYKPSRIAFSGDSAGGNLTFTSLLSVRQHKLPMPACAVPLSPWTDLECTGETYRTKADVDPMVRQDFTRQLADLYAPNRDLRDPLASPIYADLAGLPPLLIQVGDRETLLGDSLKIAELAKKAGVDVTLEIEPGQIHVFQIFAARLEEGERAIARMGAFIRRHTGG